MPKQVCSNHLFNIKEKFRPRISSRTDMKPLLFFLVLTFCNCRKLPPSFKKCNIKKPDFNQCLTEAIPDAIRQLKYPIRQLGLPSLQPLVIPEMSFAPSDGISGFFQNYTKMRVSGFVENTCSKIDLNFESQILTMKCSSPQVRLDFNYLFNGSLSVLPIYGNGTGSIVLDGVKCFHTYFLKEYQKNNKTHLRVTNGTLETTPDHVTLQFNNLFDGDKNLGDNLNLFINENWREIYPEFMPLFDEGFARVFAALFNSVLRRVPLKDFFDGY